MDEPRSLFIEATFKPGHVPPAMKIINVVCKCGEKFQVWTLESDDSIITCHRCNRQYMQIVGGGVQEIPE